jgi:hypothetical protein
LEDVTIGRGGIAEDAGLLHFIHYKECPEDAREEDDEDDDDEHLSVMCAIIQRVTQSVTMSNIL